MNTKTERRLDIAICAAFIAAFFLFAAVAPCEGTEPPPAVHVQILKAELKRKDAVIARQAEELKARSVMIAKLEAEVVKLNLALAEQQAEFDKSKAGKEQKRLAAIPGHASKLTAATFAAVRIGSNRVAVAQLLGGNGIVASENRANRGHGDYIVRSVKYVDGKGGSAWITYIQSSGREVVESKQQTRLK